MSTRARGRPTAEAAPVAPDDELLPVALAAFAEYGFEGTSVRDLCRRLGVSHNLVHQRFGSKEKLWYAAVDHGFRALAADLAKDLDDSDDDLVRLRTMLVRFVEITAAEPALVRIINQEAVAGGPRLDHLFRRYIAPVADVVDGFLRRLHEQGRVRSVPPGVFHFLVAHGAAGPVTLRALAERFGEAPAGDTAVHAYAEHVVDLLLNGIVDG